VLIVLICKGHNVGFKLQTGRMVRASGSMLHDPSGDSWPKDSVLVASFRRNGRTATDEEKAGDPKNYLGRQYEAHIGSVSLPPRSLDQWKRVGEIATVYYERPGTRAPGRFYHHFGKRRLEAFFKKGKAVLYKRGSAYRVQMGDGAVFSDRGIVFP
jgi:hypothetical protein